MGTSVAWHFSNLIQIIDKECRYPKNTKQSLQCFIKKRYDYYKQKLAAECAGQPWTMPPIGSRKPEIIQPIQNTRKQAIGLPSKEQNQDYFARMGSENSSRPENLPPSQGGKYAGFGSSPCTNLV